MANRFGEKRWEGGQEVELPVSWPWRPVGWWRELCVRVALGVKQARACGGVAVIFYRCFGVGANGGTVSRLATGFSRGDDEGRVVGSLKKGANIFRGREVSIYVSHECCSLATRPPKAGTPGRFL